MKRILSTLTVLLVAVGLSRAEAVVGKPAPAFTAKDINGKVHKLSDYKGKIVVLEAYNSDCPFCANHYKTGAMQELQAYARSKGVVWLLVNSVHAHHPSYRPPSKARAEWKKFGIQATAWLDDHTGAIGKAYGLRTTPHMIVIDRNGIVVYNGAIDNRPATSGDPRKARNYVREAIDALLAGRPVPTPTTKPYGCSVKYAR